MVNTSTKHFRTNKSHERVTSGGSVLSRYQDVIVGSKSFDRLIYFEFCIWLSKIPGALGLLFRKIFWPQLFDSWDKSVFFGENISLRHPGRIFLGDRVVISDNCILDARSFDKEKLLLLMTMLYFQIMLLFSARKAR